MPCIWGKHNNSQIFLSVAVLPVDFAEKAKSSGQRPDLRIFTALLDTGAQMTAITDEVVNAVGLKPSGKISIRGASGVEQHNRYFFKIGFPELKTGSDGKVELNRTFILEDAIRGAEFNSGSNFDVLLGMDVISTGSLKVEGDGAFSFSF